MRVVIRNVSGSEMFISFIIIHLIIRYNTFVLDIAECDNFIITLMARSSGKYRVSTFT